MLLLVLPAVVVSSAVGLLIIPRLSGGIDLPSEFVNCAAALALFLLCVRFFPPISGIASSYRVFSDYSIVRGCDVSLMFLYAAYMLRITVGAWYSLRLPMHFFPHVCGDTAE